MSQSTTPTLRDAELRVQFAKLYLIEVLKEASVNPTEWSDMVKEAQYALSVARDYYRRMLQEANGTTMLRAAG